MKILILGFGNVGKSLADIFLHQSEFPGLKNFSIQVVGVTTASRGSLTNRKGVDLEEALEDLKRSNRFSGLNPDYSEMDSIRAAEVLEYDVLVELTTLSIEESGEPATTHVRTALERNKHVVTANKGPLAFNSSKLFRLAEEKGVQLLGESTVMDGAPVFNLARYCLTGCEIVRIDGILNSTTQYVLSQLEVGRSIEEAIRDAQEAGFAEADPRHDLEGWDSAAKISILANRLMGAELTPLLVDRDGLSDYEIEEIRTAPSRGMRMVPLARAWRDKSAIIAKVTIEELPVDHRFSRLSPAGSILRIETDLMGPILIEQEGPSPTDTACGVLNDLLEIQRLTD